MAGQQERKLVSTSQCFLFLQETMWGRVWTQQPGPHQVECVWRVLPMALFWFGFRFLSKELELEGRIGRESEETIVQRFRS